MIKNENLVPVYEINGSDSSGAAKQLMVMSHGIRDTMVIICVPGSDIKITVLARDLKAAIDNATNVSRW